MQALFCHVILICFCLMYLFIICSLFSLSNVKSLLIIVSGATFVSFLQFCSLLFLSRKSKILQKQSRKSPQVMLPFEFDPAASKRLRSLLFFRSYRNYGSNGKSLVPRWKGLKVFFQSDFCSRSWKISFIKASLSSSLSAASSPFSTFRTVFLSSITMNIFMPHLLNEQKNNSSLFGEVFKILHQCITILSSRSVFEIINRYFLSGNNFSNVMNLFMLSERNTPRKFSLILGLFIS